jgi:hypothetical protein
MPIRIQSSARFNIRLIDFDGDRTHDQVDGKHHAKLVFPAHQDALRSRQRTVFHADPMSDLQVRMRFGANPLSESVNQRLDFRVWQGCGVTVETNKANYAGHLQHPQAILQIELDKDIPWKKHQVQLFAAVFPPANAAIHRQEAAHSSLF